MDETFKKIMMIEKLGESRDWGIMSPDVILKKKEVIHIARFGIRKYKKMYYHMRMMGKEDDEIFEKLDRYLLDIIEEYLPELGETTIKMYPTEYARGIDTKGEKEISYTILFDKLKTI